MFGKHPKSKSHRDANLFAIGEEQILDGELLDFASPLDGATHPAAEAPPQGSGGVDDPPAVGSAPKPGLSRELDSAEGEDPPTETITEPQCSPPPTEPQRPSLRGRDGALSPRKRGRRRSVPQQMHDGVEEAGSGIAGLPRVSGRRIATAGGFAAIGVGAVIALTGGAGTTGPPRSADAGAGDQPNVSRVASGGFSRPQPKPASSPPRPRLEGKSESRSRPAPEPSLPPAPVPIPAPPADLATPLAAPSPITSVPASDSDTAGTEFGP